MQFPALGGHLDADNGFGHMVEAEDVDVEAANTEREDQIEVLKKQLSDMNVLQQQLVESEARVRVERSNVNIALKKLEHVEKVASQRLVESLPGANFDEDSNHLAMLLATVLEKDDFEYNTDTDNVEPKSASEFLKRIEENCGNFPEKDIKLTMVKNKVLEKMKRTLRRERRLSVSGSVCSINSRSSSKTRKRSETDDLEVDNEAASKIIRPSNVKGAVQQSKLPAPITQSQ